MSYLLSSLVQIALLRKDPSILPASVVLVILTGIAFAAASALQSWILHGNDRLLGRTAYDITLAAAIFWLLLVATRNGNRFRQTISAIFGTTVLMTPFAVGLLLLQAPASSSYALKLFAWAGSVIVIVWYILIIAHILRSAIQIGFVTSLAIPLTWLIAGDALLKWLFPPVSA
jgi:hypothetical protein